MTMLNNLLMQGQFFLASSAGSNIPKKVTDAINGLDGGIASIGKAVAILMILVLGIAWMSGRSGAQWAKGSLGRVVCGLAMIVLAVDLVAWIMGIFK